MLKTIDILVGFTTVMLVVSMAVAALTQIVIHITNCRGRHLLNGLTDLLRQIDPALTGKVARKIAATVLTHPLIAEGAGRLGTVIHREELTRLLFELASGEGSQQLDDTAKVALKKSLEDHGVKDPAAALKSIRAFATQLELATPQLANDVRENAAILHEAASDYVAKLNTWFDQTIERIRGRFTFTVHEITIVTALIVAVLLQLDTVGLINRLSMDDALRSSFVQQSMAIEKSSQAATNPSAAESPGAGYYGKYYRLLAEDGLVVMPGSWRDWQDQWRWFRLPGIILSALLLGLGAPFWYSMLKGLLNLRTSIAAVDDQQRQIRQTMQDNPAASPVEGGG